MTPETLALYADDLSIFELDDIGEALEKFGKAALEQFETVFPCVGVFIAKVESIANKRKRAERERKEALEEQEKSRLYEEDRRLNPEKYAAEERAFQEKLAALNRKQGFVESKPKPTPPPVMTACPHCEKTLPLAAGIRLMTGTEVIDMGHLMVTMETQAAERAKEDRIHADKCVAAEIAKANLPSKAFTPETN